MSEQNTKLMRRMIEEVWNNQNYALADDRVATDFIGHAPPYELQGPEGVKQVFQMFHQAFPDIHFSIEEMFANGDKGVARIRFEGTHEGEFLGIEPTGKHVSATAIAISRFANDKVVEGWLNWDALDVMQQLDAVSELEVAA